MLEGEETFDDRPAGHGCRSCCGALLPFSQDLKPAIRSALDTLEHENGPSDQTPVMIDLDMLIDVEKKSFPLDTNKIDYQQRILTNQVSALDLRLYMYTKKLRLLFRRARNTVLPGKLKLGAHQYDIGRVSEICAQALEFINFASRALRRDLYNAWGGQEGLSEQETGTQKLVIDNLVASWKVSAILQILDECQVSHILADKMANPFETPIPRRQRVDISPSPMNTPLVRPSPNVQLSLFSPLENRQSPIVAFQPSPQPQREAPHSDSRERLAMWTAELLVALRDIVEVVCPRAVNFRQRLSQGQKNDTPGNALDNKKTSGIRSASLKAAYASDDDCVALYRMLTVYAYRCYSFANQIQASRQMILNLAQMDLADNQPQAGRNWIEQIPDLLDTEMKTLTDLALFKCYTQCLDKDDQPNEYARCLLGILQFSNTNMGLLALSRADIQLENVLDALLYVSSKTQSYDFPFSALFQASTIDYVIRHQSHRDGFVVSVRISLRQKLNIQIDDTLSLSLITMEAGEPHIIYLSAIGPHKLNSMPKSIDFISNTTVAGTYRPERLYIQIGNLHFVQSLEKIGAVDNPMHQAAAKYLSRMVLYPRTGSFSVRAHSSNTTDLTQSARITFHVEAQDNEVDECFIRIKPATGGFRLDVQAAKVEDKQESPCFELILEDRTHMIRFGKLTKSQSITLNIPYTIENPMLPAVQLKIEATYFCGGETFKAHFDHSVSITLPITVNVQDIFQPGAIFLRFTAGPAGKVPLRIIKWDVEQQTSHPVLASSPTSHAVVNAFSKLPASWVARIDIDRSEAQELKKLKLVVLYHCMDEIVFHAISSIFSKALKGCPAAHVASLLENHLKTELPKLWTDNDFEAITLLQEVQMVEFEALRWDHVLQALDATTRNMVDAWLRSWHAENQWIDLAPTESLPRLLKLFVDVPRPSILISTQIHIDDSCKAEHYELGKAISAWVLITCDDSNDGNIEIQFDLNAAPDVWLLAGKKRGHLHHTIDIQQVPITLIPQKIGHLLLPSIDIRCRPLHNDDPKFQTSCEVEHRSQAETLHVVQALQSVTLAAGDHDQPGTYEVIQKRFRSPRTNVVDEGGVLRTGYKV